MGLSIETLRRGFFDQSKVVRAVSLAKRKAFGKAGAYVRQRDRSSIRRKKGSAPPGQPPHAHAPGNSGIKLIFFAWDQRSESVVVGAVKFDGAKGPKDGARLTELGGEAQARDGKGRPRRVRYRPHPHTGPALKAEAPKFAGLFKGSLPGG